VGLLWTSDQPDAETSTWHHTTLRTGRHPYPPGGIRTRNPTWRPAANPHLRPRSHQNPPLFCLRLLFLLYLLHYIFSNWKISYLPISLLSFGPATVVFRLLPQNVNTTILKKTLIRLFFYVCVTQFIRLVLWGRVARRIFYLNARTCEERGDKWILRTLITCSPLHAGLSLWLYNRLYCVCGMSLECQACNIIHRSGGGKWRIAAL
jgi:hypothetical protein